ncbi:hypothetical protein [Sediminicola sp. 1XM1-17]|uniref:hypothetical protein n=1 Tax=Sediminicola sp. 1XM1-17 TaxID=3127702 RepID=UPI003077B156
MGLFDRFKKESDESRKSRLKEILSDIGCNPYDFNHDEMESYELSLQEELDEVIIGSEITYDNRERDFDFVSLNDYQNGTKFLYMAMNNRDTRETRNLIDRYSSRLGEDMLLRKEFKSVDLYELENEPKGHLRTWELTFFNITIGYSNEDNINTTYVVVYDKFIN